MNTPVIPHDETEGSVIPINDPSNIDGIKVLVVDDNKINRKLACTLAAKHGAIISESENGQQAISKAQDDQYDLILMDIHMPIMNGEDASKKIREIYSGKKQPTIIALTANAMPGEKERLMNNGLMDGCLIKPITEEQLCDIINGCAKLKSASSSSNPINKQKRFDSKSEEKKKDSSSLERELFDMLKAELPVHKDRIAKDYSNNEMIALKDSVHKLHGAASVCGVPELKSACNILENLLRDEKYDEVNPAYKSMLEEIEKILNG